MADQLPISAFLLFPLFLLFSLTTSSTNFNFRSISPNEPNISVLGSAVKTDGTIRLIDSQFGGSAFNSSGRAYYNQPIQLWDPSINITANFTTYFEFSIQYINQDSNSSSGGIAFFLASENSSLSIPSNSFGKWLGLFNESTNDNPSTQMVAVEFDTYQDSWDPSNNHVGIDVNSIVSKANRTWSNTMTSGDILGATISYNGVSNELSVHLKDPQVPVDFGSLSLTYRVRLNEVLPERVIVGFSGSSGARVTIQQIRKWNFTSSLDVISGFESNEVSKETWTVGLTVAVVASATGATVGAGLLFLLWRRNANKRKGDDRVEEEEDEEEEEERGFGISMSVDFERGTGPKRFTYKELASATNNFSEEQKLGQGGFGGVYKGFSTHLDLEMAVKRISKGSKQGRKEYISEVMIISRLRHRNLVQLLGWSHERRELLLVYEYMPNGSLDTHLFGKKSTLTWELRHKIALGLASALLYLHEEWEQCVVHRDIKSSNIMLDSGFNAKLGDFGLARLMDHDMNPRTTALAGTLGYLAPECFNTGKANKESDVYSFGIVVLEIACGRQAVVAGEVDEYMVRLVEWVWGFYGNGRLLEAADKRLGNEFDEKQMECLMIVGLWCAHPDHTLRPSIRQAIQVLNFEAPKPSLPRKMPVPMYRVPSIHHSESLQPSLTFSSLGIGR